jgi:hypothetical protein
MSRILYTKQSLDFDIVNQKVDLSKSSLYCDDSLYFKKAYDYLFSLIGKDSFIWCHGEFDFDTEKPTKFEKKNFKKEVLWILEVPDNYITCINRDLWDYIIADWKWFGNDHFYKYVWELGISEEWVEVLDKAMEKLPKEETWKNLIRKNKKDWRITDDFIIPSPIKKSWVSRKYVLEEI